MVKRILLLAFLFLPLAVSAQSDWEIPAETVKQEAPKPVKTATDAKSRKPTYSVEVIDGKTYNVKDEDKPYLKGAVPEVDGKVVFSADIETSGLTAKEAYDIVYATMDSLAKCKNQNEESHIAIVNTKENSIVGIFNEKLIFSSSALQLDYTQFNYIIIANCLDDSVHISMERLYYKYDTGKEIVRLVAEDTIVDSKMLDNDGTKLKRLNSKFRRATVDRMREVIAVFRKALK